MIGIKIVAFNNASISKDEVDTPFRLEDVVENRSERGILCDVRLVESCIWSQRLGCFFTPFDIHIEEVKMPATSFRESSGHG